jgi:UDP-N-acetylmuramate dehydrogenase
VELINNASLKSFTTFGVEAACDHLYRMEEIEELRLAVQYLEQPLILGGGSNILPLGNIHRNVLRVELKGIRIVEEGEHPLVKFAAGEIWHEVVLWALENDLGGIENLSLIPGTVGAAPIQNIGAYGVELSSVFHSLDAIEMGTGRLKTFSKEECHFGYRDSIFKNELRHQYVIVSVTLRLSRTHKVDMSYGAILQTLKDWNIDEPGIRDISKAVIHIRQSKLPDPSEVGNAGSFFKNPIISSAEFEALKKDHPNIPGYPAEAYVKVPAGWLIEQAGWKGRKVGNVGCYEKQALVLINLGGAKGEEVWSFAQEIISSVKDKFNVRLEPEVNFWS